MKRSRNRRKSNAPQNLILEEIIGLTTKNANGLSSSDSSSMCAYIAGCVVVLYDVVSTTQSHLMSPNRVPKPLSCVALSRDSSVVAAGESGHRPAVLVWNCATLAFICELKCHSYGVACLALSADGKYVVSAGNPRDGYICIWDCRNKLLASKVKSSSVPFPITSIEFSINRKFIVAAEKNQLKFLKVRWPPGSRVNARSVSLSMLRKVDLGPKESFVAVASPSWTSSTANPIRADEPIPFYAVTEKGTLYMVYPGSLVSKSVDLEVEKCYAISTSTNLVACACNSGVVKLFGTSSLEYAGRLCYVETKRCKESDFADCQSITRQIDLQSKPAHPDAIACQFSTLEKLVVVYNDHSLYIWDIHDIHKATRCCVLVSHSGCIWDIKNVPCENLHDPSLSCAAKGCTGGLSFATCSADGSIRLWDLALQSTSSNKSLSFPGNDNSCGAMCLAGAGIFERDSVAKDISSNGFRAMAVSSDGRHLAAGDCQGNIHIFNLYTSNYIFIQDAHGAEVLSMSFNLIGKDCFASGEEENHLFLASAGGDGLIHLFDVPRNFNLHGSINYHSSAVTVVKVARNGREILSCGADRSLVLHSLDVSDIGCKISCLRKITSTGTIYDVAVDNPMDVAITVGEAKKINAFDIQSGKLIKWFQQDGDVGNPIKVAVDGSNSYLACACSDRCIFIYDYATGEMVAQARGHSGFVTGIIFLSDCTHLVSVDSDGCIFVWKLPALLSSRMLQRTKEIPCQFPRESINMPMASNQLNSNLLFDLQQKDCSKDAPVTGVLSQCCSEMFIQDGSNLENAAFRFSISRLPKWARYQVSNNSLHMDIDSNSSKVESKQDIASHQSRSVSKDNQEFGQQCSGNESRCLSELDSNPSSSPPESYTRASNTRWLTIHTVCMDLLDSPTTCDMKGLNMQGSMADNRCTGLVAETTHSNKRIKLSSPSTSISDPLAEPNSGSNEQVNLHDVPSDECMHTSASSNGFRDEFWSDNSVFSSDTDKEHKAFKMDSGNLSAELKAERGKSLIKSNYPFGFLVRRDLLEGRKRSLCMHAQDSYFSPKKPFTSRLEDAGNAPASSDTEKVESPWKSVDKGSVDADKSGEAETVKSCEEALRNLEAAAENAVQSFCKLATLNIGEEESRKFERIHLVEKKIQVIAKLFQPSTNFQCEKMR